MTVELNIYAYDLKRGDYLFQTRENGKTAAGSAYVQRVTVTDDEVTYRIACGISDNDFTVPAHTPMTVERAS